jgi:hypothetical protein
LVQRVAVMLKTTLNNSISTMDVEEVIAVYYIYNRYMKKKKKKKYWIHPFLQTKDETRHFDIFFENLKNMKTSFLVT